MRLIRPAVATPRPFLAVFALLCACLALLLVMMPASRASAASSDDFYDVWGHWVVNDPNAGGANWVDYVVGHGIMTGRTSAGVPTGEFSPDDLISRAEFATVLYRIAYPDSASTTDPGSFATVSAFSDAAPGQYYTAALNWCNTNGIVKGDTTATGEATGTVRPYDAVSRQEFCTMLYRFARVLKLDTGSREVLGYDSSAFYSAADAALVEPYAVIPMGWAADTGTVGSAGFLNPFGYATRAEAAKMISVVHGSVLSTLPVFALLYSDGTLVLQNGGAVRDGHLNAGLTVDIYGAVAAGQGLAGRWGGIENLQAVVPWTSSSAGLVTRVEVWGTVELSSARLLFAGLPNLLSVDLAGLDLSEADSLVYMFLNDSSLQQLDLSGVEVPEDPDAYGIIQGCNNLGSVILGTGSAQGLAAFLSSDAAHPWISIDGMVYTEPTQAAPPASGEDHPGADAGRVTDGAELGQPSVVDLSAIDESLDTASAGAEASLDTIADAPSPDADDPGTGPGSADMGASPVQPANSADVSSVSVVGFESAENGGGTDDAAAVLAAA